MEADPFDARGIANEAELPDVVRPQGQQRVAGAGAVLPVLFVRDYRGVFRDADFQFTISFFAKLPNENSPNARSVFRQIAERFFAI